MRVGCSAAAFLGGGLLLLATAGGAAAQSSCQEHYDSTFAVIQTVVFGRHGCTSTGCHVGPTAAAGLDLSPDVAYNNLVDHPVQSISTDQYPGLARVVPGYKARSLLWLNLAGATLPSQWHAPLRPMPIGFPALTLDELDIVRLWIENGATREGVVPGTSDLVDACLPPPEPLQVEPLPPPPSGAGVQLRAPHQVLPPTSERETCFVSYYDLTGHVPEESLGPNGDTFRYKRVDARQDPLSHHAVVIVYQGATPIESTVWGPFACRGGARDGTSCIPTDLGACGDDGVCASPPVQAVACIGYGPGDASIGVGEKSLFNTMSVAIDGRNGIYEEIPLKGILVWNSHAFNVTDSPAPLDIWINLYAAAKDEQIVPLQRFTDVSAIAKMHVPAFGLEEICQHHILPAGSRVLELSSHVHQRGKRFRIFAGDFACRGGPHNGDPCSPMRSDRSLPLPDPCAGAPCQSSQGLAAPPPGDCNRDLHVSTDELVMSLHIALGSVSRDRCPDADVNQDGEITVDELVMAVDAAIHPGVGNPQASLIYTSLTYSDPLVLTYDPPKLFGAAGSSAAQRTLTYCALYDNGYSNPLTVKRRSQTPTNGSPCKPTNCTAGLVEDACTSNSDCNSTPGTTDGVCDACPVGFGVTTEDEMFVLAGSHVFE